MEGKSRSGRARVGAYNATRRAAGRGKQEREYRLHDWGAASAAAASGTARMHRAPSYLAYVDYGCLASERTRGTICSFVNQPSFCWVRESSGAAKPGKRGSKRLYKLLTIIWNPSRQPDHRPVISDLGGARGGAYATYDTYECMCTGAGRPRPLPPRARQGASLQQQRSAPHNAPQAPPPPRCSVSRQSHGNKRQCTANIGSPRQFESGVHWARARHIS